MAINRDATHAPGRVPGRTTSNILQGYRRLSNFGEQYSLKLYSAARYWSDIRSAATENPSNPSGVIASLRVLVHDLSNSLDSVLQAAYLLQEAKLDGKNKKWIQAIDTAARDAARINREINAILNSQR
jgi:signal transduction histidine kinase